MLPEVPAMPSSRAVLAPLLARPLVAGLVVLLVPLSLAGPAAAQERLRPTRTLDVEADGQEVRAVLDDIGRRAGVTIVVDRRVKGTISLHLRQVSWRDAVGIIARSARCKLEELPGGGLLVRQPQRISVQLTDADVRTALLLLARYGGRSIVIAPDVRGRVTLDLHDVEWSKAFAAIVATAGDFAVLGLDQEQDAILVGSGGGAPEAAPDLVFTAELVELGETTARVRLVDDGTELDLEPSPAARRLLSPLRAGARVVLSCEQKDGHLVIASCVVQSSSDH
jgi:type II secretory pathway component GspD/PulD (secretin)